CRWLRSIEAHEAIRPGDQIVHDSQTAEGGLFTYRDVSALCRVRAGEQFQTAGSELFQTGIAQAFDRRVDTVEIDIHAVCQCCFRQANGVVEITMLGRNGDKHAKFFPAQRHVSSLSKGKEAVKLRYSDAGRIQ